MVIAIFDAARADDRAHIERWLRELGFASLFQNVLFRQRAGSIGSVRQALSRRRTKAAARVALLRVTPAAFSNMQWRHWKEV